jgi:hypothetical protein
MVTPRVTRPLTDADREWIVAHVAVVVRRALCTEGPFVVADGDELYVTYRAKFTADGMKSVDPADADADAPCHVVHTQAKRD